LAKQFYTNIFHCIYGFSCASDTTIVIANETRGEILGSGFRETVFARLGVVVEIALIFVGESAFAEVDGGLHELASFETFREVAVVETVAYEIVYGWVGAFVYIGVVGNHL
jgi:hypothetical protein